MSISQKNKRKVIANDKKYIWWVYDEFDQTEFDGIQVKIVSTEQTHFFKYGLQQENGNHKVVFALKDYTKLIHLPALKFEDENGIITNSGIRRLLLWCKNEQQHNILYALNKNKLTEQQKQLLLKEMKTII